MAVTTSPVVTAIDLIALGSVCSSITTVLACEH